jgi:hypothetical protein
LLVKYPGNEEKYFIMAIGYPARKQKHSKLNIEYSILDVKHSVRELRDYFKNRVGKS